MKTITIEIEDDDVVVVLNRPPGDGYEDVHPFLLAEDAVRLGFNFELPWLDHYSEKWKQ